jgi:hypothetical protein
MATTTNYGWETADDTDLVKDGALAMRTLGSAIDTTTKALNPSTTLGDIEYRSATANTNTRLAIGTTGQVLTVAAGVPSWATPAGGGGKVLQMVSAVYTTRTDVASTSYTDSGLSASITPTLATSKILILITMNLALEQTASSPNANVRIMRNSTAIFNDVNLSTNEGSIRYNGVTEAETNGVNWSYVDSPATTSSVTYKTQMAVKNTASGSTISTNKRTGSGCSIILLEIGA